VQGDYNGDRRCDVGVYDKVSGAWHIIYSGSGTPLQTSWGWNLTPPVPADYDGDGKCDIAVYYPVDGSWYIRRSSTGLMLTGNPIVFGYGSGVPVIPQFWINVLFGDQITFLPTNYNTYP
jgi:hypothetical protein